MAWIQEYLVRGITHRSVYERINGEIVCERAGYILDDANRIKNKLEKQKFDSRTNHTDLRATLWAYCDKYEFLPKRREENTKRIIHLAMIRVKEFFLNKKLIADVVPDEIDGFIKYLYDVAKFNHTTAHIVMRNLRAVLNLAKANGILKINPSNAKIIDMGEPEPRVIFLSSADKEKLYATIWKLKFRPVIAKREMVNLIKVMLHTGLRRSEVVNLRKEHMINENSIVIPSRRRMRRNTSLITTKSSKPYTIDLNSEIKPIFDAIKEGPIFPGWTIVTINERFRRVADAAGFPELTPHGLRHTFASDLLAKKVPIDEVQEMLNHSSLDITKKFYSHREPGRLAANFELLATEPQLKIAV